MIPFADTEAGEVGLEVCLYHAAPAIVVVAIAAAEALFTADPLLRCLDLMPLQEMTGAARNQNRHWNPSHPSALPKQSRCQGQGRDHLREAQTGRRVWSHMMTVLQIRNVESRLKLC